MRQERNLKNSIKETIQWLRSLNAFLDKVQTPEEKLRMESLRKQMRVLRY